MTKKNRAPGLSRQRGFFSGKNGDEAAHEN